MRFVVAPGARRVCVVLVVLAVGAAVALAVRYAGAATAGRLDSGLIRVVDGVPEAFRLAVRPAVWLGDPELVVGCALGVALVGLLTRRYRLAVVAVLGPMLTGGAVLVLQPAIGRTLDGVDALPSGHTAGAVALALVVALAGTALPLGLPERWVFGLAAVAVAAVSALVAFALVGNGLHYPTDTVAGLCTAVAGVLGAALATDLLADRMFGRRDHG